MSFPNVGKKSKVMSIPVMDRKVTPADNKALEISCNEKWTEKHLGFSPCYRLNFVLEPDSS